MDNAREVRELAATAAATTPENPWPIRLLSTKVDEYVRRMSALWVEGELVQLNRRPGSGMSFMVVRDVDVDMSFSVAVRSRVLDASTAPLEQGARIVLHAKPTFWTRRGSLQLEAAEIRPVGVGELLARLEHLKRVLAAEGLFDEDRKKPLPFLPGTIGLITGRESAAERDVVVNSQKRWSGVRFEIREVAVQGPRSAGEVLGALRELDAREDVEVIVIARGGGSMEDLLPFSDETLVRAVAAAATPVVSAIGHEIDQPILDFVADLRASTPTDAAKRIVPDMRAEAEGLEAARLRLRQAVRGRLSREAAALDALLSRPVLADPSNLLAGRAEEIDRHVSLGRRLVRSQLERAAEGVAHLRTQVRSLSPQATLDRGYAVVQVDDDAQEASPGSGHAAAPGTVVRSPADAPMRTPLRIRLARGEIGAFSRGDRHDDTTVEEEQ